MDLDVTLNISVKIVGDRNGKTKKEIYLSHLGKNIFVEIPNSIRAEQTLHLKGLGKISSTGEKGDLYLKLDSVEYVNTNEKYCINCGQELTEGARFCAGCGTAVGIEKNSNKRQREWAGKSIDCPQCGEIVPSFTAICPSCGLELRDTANSNAIRDFTIRLQNSKSRSEKIAIIRNFPIPNTKEDIYEFMILASSNISVNLENDISDAWQSKIEQAYKKAELILQNKNEFNTIQSIYNKTSDKLKEIQKNNMRKKRRFILSELTPVLPNVIIVLGWLMSIFSLIPLSINNPGIKVILFADYIVAAILLPKVFKCDSILPRLITSSGLILGIILLIIQCLSNGKSTEYNFMLFVSIICTITIFARMLQYKINAKAKFELNKAALIITGFSVLLLLIVYGICFITTSFSENNLINSNSPTITVNEKTDDNKGVYTYQIRNYIGKNVASIGTVSNGYQIDEYGNGELKIIYVTEDGMLISPLDNELKQQYVVVEQNIKPGTNITIVHLRDSNGEPYSSSVDYQSYDEIILYVTPIESSTYNPEYTDLLPTLDRHEYHIRDYVGRNAASFGEYNNKERIDIYGAGELRITFTSESGEFIDSSDANSLKQYIVVSQDIAANSNLKLIYETDSDGAEYDNLIRSQSYDEINLVVKKLDDITISHMPTLENNSTPNEYVELTLKYAVVGNGEAEITGFSGKGNHATINSKIDGYEIVGIGESAFEDCTTLESVLFWAEIDAIGNHAFSGCTSLKEINIPFETTDIGDYAFQDCTALSSVVIWGDPDIGKYAFAGCTSLTSINIGYDTKKVGEHAFDGCISLSEAIIWNDDTSIGKDAFANCPKLNDRPIQE